MAAPQPRHDRPSEQGFALVLALLALTLLTFLGLTLASTTSVDLQSATNYRWGRQAHYNAEAGLEAGRMVLRSMEWSTILPAVRSGSWSGTASPAAPPAAPFSRATRNFERGTCDSRGNGMGYGVVMDDGGAAPAPYQTVSRLWGQSLNGHFTLWVRRPLVVLANGALADDPSNNLLVLTAEGVAPYTTATAAANAAGAAVRTLEMTLSRSTVGGTWSVAVREVWPTSRACR